MVLKLHSSTKYNILNHNIIKTKNSSSEDSKEEFLSILFVGRNYVLAVKSLLYKNLSGFLSLLNITLQHLQTSLFSPL
ncbi:MAG: hypothetical protein C4K58_08585 [Flavobacteriaceae bacterium]|nr:MAG: hypothetical protein C4K58_08585 [Flavobacteriaceae bacterium]